MKSSNAKNSQWLAVQGNDVSAKIRLNSCSNASEHVGRDHGASCTRVDDRPCAERVFEVSRTAGLHENTRQSTNGRDGTQTLGGFTLIRTVNGGSWTWLGVRHSRSRLALGALPLLASRTNLLRMARLVTEKTTNGMLPVSFVWAEPPRVPDLLAREAQNARHRQRFPSRLWVSWLSAELARCTRRRCNEPTSTTTSSARRECTNLLHAGRNLHWLSCRRKAKLLLELRGQSMQKLFQQNRVAIVVSGDVTSQLKQTTKISHKDVRHFVDAHLALLEWFESSSGGDWKRTSHHSRQLRLVCLQTLGQLRKNLEGITLQKQRQASHSLRRIPPADVSQNQKLLPEIVPILCAFTASVWLDKSVELQRHHQDSKKNSGENRLKKKKKLETREQTKGQKTTRRPLTRPEKKKKQHTRHVYRTTAYWINPSEFRHHAFAERSITSTHTNRLGEHCVNEDWTKRVKKRKKKEVSSRPDI